MHVKFEHLGHGFGLGFSRPRISWQVQGAPPNWAADEYEVELVTHGEVQRRRVLSGDQVLVPWPFAPLVSREQGSVRVRVASGSTWTGWSEPAAFETTLLTAANWSAQMISPVGLGGLAEPAPVLSRRFEVRDIREGRLYISAHGIYEVFLNDVRVGNEHLAPGWTAYEHRLRFQTHDVTDLLRVGTNEMSILLGNGWYRGHMSVVSTDGHYGQRLAALAQLEVNHNDGDVTRVVTDESWSSADSCVVSNDWYDGQETDFTRSCAVRVGGVEAIPFPLERLVVPSGPPVRVTDVVPAVQVFRSPSGKQLVDFGQNLVGWVRIRPREMSPGAKVVVRHAEVLEDGELAVAILRSAKATDSYIVSGEADQVLEPSLTFHGFRFAEITGVDVFAADVDAIVIGTDLVRTGWFECSEPLVNKLHDNVVWSMRGNFVDVPTDCPQRDERLGWTGDLQIFAPTASFLFDCCGMLSSWLQDLAAEQHQDGSVPFVIPDVLPSESPAACAWGDAATIVPSVLYERFGDVDIIKRQYSSMKSWVDHVSSRCGEEGLWTGGFQFGDWLDPTAPPEDATAAQANPDVVATAHRARSAQLLAAAARSLGYVDDELRYAALSARVKEAFQAEYVTLRGRILSDSATVYSMALAWQLLDDPDQLRHAGERLADIVRTSGYRISTGFVGTPLVCDALTKAGQHDVAHRLLLQTGCPSWLYPITRGATTIWERWDSLTPDDHVNTSTMTSFNHYALGAVADWLHRRIAGLAPVDPGYRTIMVAPEPGKAITSASARLVTPYGLTSVTWQRSSERFTMTVIVPVGSSALVTVPGVPVSQRVGHGEHSWDVPWLGTDRGKPETVRDLLDDVGMFTQMVELLVAYGEAEGDQEVARRLAPYLDYPADFASRAYVPAPLLRSDDLSEQLALLFAGA